MRGRMPGPSGVVQNRAGKCNEVGVAGADWKTDEILAQEAVTAIGATWA